jgi:hypothetical protein
VVLEGRILLFVNKKKQKNFIPLRAPDCLAGAVDESFFASFFTKKEALSYA